MKYKYPCISNTLSYRRIDTNSVEVIDHLTDNTFMLGIEITRYGRKLDGFTHPYKIPSVLNREERDEVLDFFDEYDLIRRSNNINISFGTKLKTLWIPKMTPILRAFAYISNALLLLSWFPVLICGIILFANKISYVNFDGLWIGYLIGLLFGLVCHELGHAFAAISYRARVFELGIMVMYCILPGAYVLMDRTVVKSRMQRIQIIAAGVETNFLLAGIFLIMGSIFPCFGGAFLNAAISNTFIGVFNLTFIKGLDGTSIMSELFGIDEIIGRAQKIVFNRRTRQRVIRHRKDGFAIVCMCYMLFVLQIALPILLITNILEVVSCFV